MRSSLGRTGRGEGNLRNISEGCIMHCREGIEVSKVTGHLILGSSICGTLDIGLVPKEFGLIPFPFEGTFSSVWDIRHTGSIVFVL